MKGVTLTQPEPSQLMGLADGEFAIIKRKKTDYRGLLAIHAGLNRSLIKSDHGRYEFGSVIGTVELVDSFHHRAVPLEYQHLDWAHSFAGWAWLVTKPQKLTQPIRLDGSPSLWDWPAGDALILAEQLARAIPGMIE